MRIVIYGASDDLVEIDGDLREEFYAQKADEDEGADYLALSTGTLIKITYDGEWSLRVVRKGSAVVTTYQWNDRDETDRVLLGSDVPDYSDAVKVEADEIEWVLHGSGLVTPATSVPVIE